MTSVPRPREDTLDVLHDISQLLQTGLDRETLAVLVGLTETGVNPEALAAVVKELRRESAAIAAESTHANARVPVRRRHMASCVACTPPRPFIRPHAPSLHASLVLPLCSDRSVHNDLIFASPTLVRLPLPPARPSQVHITSPPEGVRRQVLAQPEHLHSAELPRPPDPRLEALLPVSFLWPRGALRRRSPRPARDDNAGPRLVPCLTRCAARRPDTFITSSYSQHALGFSSV